MFKGLLGKVGGLFGGESNVKRTGGNGMGGPGMDDIAGPDSDYGRALRGERAPAFNDAMEGQMTNRAKRNFAKRFDPSNKEDVLKMQLKLNAAGYRDSDGNELSPDGQMGNKTLSALRAFQGKEFERVQSKGERLYGEENASQAYEPGKDPAGPMGPPTDEEMNQEPTMQRNREPEQGTLDRMFSPSGSMMGPYKGYTQGGHRILGNAMSKTIDRAQKKYDGDRKFALEEKQFAENQKRNSLVNQVAEMNIAGQQKTLDDSALRESEYNRLYDANKFNPEARFFDDAGGLIPGSGDFFSGMSGVDMSDVDSGIDFLNRRKMSTELSDITSAEGMSHFLDRAKSAGIEGDALNDLIATNPEFEKKFRAFQLTQRGKNYTDTNDESLYNVNNPATGKDDTGINSTVFNSPTPSGTDKGHKKTLDKAMENLKHVSGKSRDETIWTTIPSADELSINQKGNGSWELIDKDFFDDDEHEITFVDGKPSVTIDGTTYNLSDLDAAETQKLLEALE